MRKRLLLLCAGTFFLAGQIRAQWVVTDPGNLAQSIINMSDNIVHTSSTATSTAQNFAETVKIYQQYKKYYDALKSVNNLVKDARKVSEIILMVARTFLPKSWMPSLSVIPNFWKRATGCCRTSSR